MEDKLRQFTQQIRTKLRLLLWFKRYSMDTIILPEIPFLIYCLKTYEKDLGR